jgi:DNA-directed RNA polymerase specialized sigma24 family protein
MSELELSSGLLEALDRLSETGDADGDDGAGDAAQRLVDLEGVDADARLVKRCIAGEVAAWEELYDQCHPALLRSIEHLLGDGRADPNLVDELAARVWYALVAKDGKLLAKFDAERGARLGTFMRCIAKDVGGRHFRSESRRRRRERAAGKRRPIRHGTSGDAGSTMADLAETLTPGEQEFLEQCLLSNDPTEESSREYSTANMWKLASRIRRKIKEFFGAESQDG